MKTFLMLALSAATILGVSSAKAAGCREGQTETFLENTDSSAEHMSPVTYVCRDGRFVGKYGPTYQERVARAAAEDSIRGCREGQTEMFLENTDSSAEHMEPVWYVCRNGKFTGQYGPTYQERVSAAAAKAGHRGCYEGQREIFLEQVDSSSENLVPVTYVCRDGKFRDVYGVHHKYGRHGRYGRH